MKSNVQVVSTPLMVPLAVQLHWTDVARMAVHIHYVNIICVKELMTYSSRADDICSRADDT